MLKIEKAREVRAELATEALNHAPGSSISGDALEEGKSASLNDNYGDTVPSRPQEIPLPNQLHTVSSSKSHHVGHGAGSPGEGDFGTFIVHTVAEVKDAAIKEPTSVGNESIADKDVASSSHVLGDKAALWAEKMTGSIANHVPDKKLNQNSQGIQGTLPSQRGSVDKQLRTDSFSHSRSQLGTLKSTTVSRKSFALQDKLWSIYAAGNTVPIPFLRATDISPIALVSDNMLGFRDPNNSGTIALEAVQELFSGDGQGKKGRRGQNEMPLPQNVYQRLTTSSTLLNLAQALAYHKTYIFLFLPLKFFFFPLSLAYLSGVILLTGRPRN